VSAITITSNGTGCTAHPRSALGQNRPPSGRACLPIADMPAKAKHSSQIPICGPLDASGAGGVLKNADRAEISAGGCLDFSASRPRSKTEIFGVIWANGSSPTSPAPIRLRPRMVELHARSLHPRRAPFAAPATRPGKLGSRPGSQGTPEKRGVDRGRAARAAAASGRCDRPRLFPRLFQNSAGIGLGYPPDTGALWPAKPLLKRWPFCP
jgi:hypothetical protein